MQLISTSRPQSPLKEPQRQLIEVKNYGSNYCKRQKHTKIGWLELTNISA
jgi:hypothetical protein